MPPRADQVIAEKDPVAEALIADEESEDPLLNMMQEAMSKTGDFASEETQHALKGMDKDIKRSKMMHKKILKEMKKRAETKKKRFAGVDRFNALRNRFFSFKQPKAQLMETGDVRHTKAAPVHTAPGHYSPVPVGDSARKASADLASGADAARNEDWQVHQATYNALHPSALEVKKAEEKAEGP